jgi:hypothetical protein
MPSRRCNILLLTLLSCVSVCWGNSYYPYPIIKVSPDESFSIKAEHDGLYFFDSEGEHLPICWADGDYLRERFGFPNCAAIGFSKDGSLLGVVSNLSVDVFDVERLRNNLFSHIHDEYGIVFSQIWMMKFDRKLNEKPVEIGFSASGDSVLIGCEYDKLKGKGSITRAIPLFLKADSDSAG